VSIARHGGFGSGWHLVVRFFGALLPVGPSRAAEDWAGGHLLPAERSLFAAMSGPDRRHAIGVAREALRLAAEDGHDPAELPASFVTAALLHDVGKNDARLGTFARVWTTIAALAFGRARIVGDSGGGGADEGNYRTRSGLARQRARMASYLQHDRIGAEMLAGAGSDELTIAWAREHHLAESRWTVDEQLGGYLKRADGD